VTAQRTLPFERCNIGPAEIARRRRLAIVLTALTILLIAALLAAQVPPVGRLAVFPFAAAIGVTWLQVIRKFCVHFGAFGLENFGELGEEHRVAPEIRWADLRQSFEMILEGLLFGLLVTIAVLQVPS
jgi:hypothetical protein